MLPGTSPGGVNVWSAVRSALVSWYSEIKGWGETERWGVVLHHKTFWWCININHS